jgi:EAL and modified HD-GYP domain-containing signal transduction protein
MPSSAEPNGLPDQFPDRSGDQFPDQSLLLSPVPASSLLEFILGYEPIVDRKQSVFALRVQLRASTDDPTRPQTPQLMSLLYADMSRDWPLDSHAILLSAPQAVLDEGLLKVVPNPNVWLEVPAELAGVTEIMRILHGLHRKGYSLVLRGRTVVPLAPSLVPAFMMSIIHVNDDRRLQSPERPAPTTFKRSINYAQDGVTSIALMKVCFKTGAYAVLGWPMHDAVVYRDPSSLAPSDMIAIMRLITMAEGGEDARRMEAVISHDPAILERLLRYINSVRFGLNLQVESFRQAIMLLGYQKLKRWLSLLLATSSQDANMRPVMLASFRRAVLLEQLLGQSQDEKTRDEIFILGVFSLLDKLMKKPFKELFSTIPVPASVREALVDGSGPFMPYLRIAEAIENGPDPGLLEKLGECRMTLGECNQAVLRTLRQPKASIDGAAFFV